MAESMENPCYDLGPKGLCPSTCQNNDAPRCQNVGWNGRIVNSKIKSVPVDMPKRHKCARRHAKTDVPQWQMFIID